jgi:hypothetical protein
VSHHGETDNFLFFPFFVSFPECLITGHIASGPTSYLHEVFHTLYENIVNACEEADTTTGKIP